MVGVQAMVLGRLGMKPSPHPRACALSCPSPFAVRDCWGSGLYNAPPGRAGFSPSYLARPGRRGELRSEVHGAVRNRWTWWRGSDMRVRQPITKESSMTDGDSYAYVCEKFAVALDEIAAGEGPVKMRLHNAYISSLSRLSEEDLPEELREEFSSIYESASWLPPEAPEEGMMASTATHMTDEEARELCRRLVWLVFEILAPPDA